MRHRYLLGICALALSAGGILGGVVWAQDAPESLLPPGFDRPAARPSPKPSASAAPAAPAPVVAPSLPGTISSPVVQPLPGGAAPVNLPPGLPSLDKLEAMSPEDLDTALGLRPRSDIPASAARALTHLGMIDEGEGGLPGWSLAHQDQTLVSTLFAGNSGELVSRWGHILLRRALASRMDAPDGMNPADFVALRAQLLVRMGEGAAARALVQDVDTANYSPMLTEAAIQAYSATGDFTGLCPAIALQGRSRKDAAGKEDRPWQVWSAVCDAFSGNSAHAMEELDRLTYYGAMPHIDMLLAQKYAGAAGKARRNVTIEWTDVKDMTPWRYGMTLAVGLTPPAGLTAEVRQYPLIAAAAPMLGLADRARAADSAAGAGVLSSAAMVDLYSQIYDDSAAPGAGKESEEVARAARLRDAYLAESPADRLAAIRDIWGSGGNGDDGSLRFASRQVLTAYAAARLPVSPGFADDAGGLIASMLAAGLDANALRWAGTVKSGSQGWALLALADPADRAADTGAIDDFHKNDPSRRTAKTRFLIAGLAGLGRLDAGKAGDLAQKYGFTFDYASRWSKAIDKAAAVGNPELVALLAGLGMQGDGWNKMTARNLYHIVAALNRVGLGAEARMIAAEAVARG